jgi:predicted nucleic acid-binding protein
LQAHASEYVLHPSVASAWWIWRAKYSEEARSFLRQRLESAQVGVIAFPGFELRVLAAIAKDLHGIVLDPRIAVGLSHDIHEQFAFLTDQRLLRNADWRELAQPAFLIATSYAVAFEDALWAALAAGTQAPLLVADDEAYARLKRLEPDLAGFRTLSLSEYWNAP